MTEEATVGSMMTNIGSRMTEFVLNTVELTLLFDSLESACADVDPSTADVAEITCNSDGMKEYRARLSTLGDLWRQYKTLLENDVTIFRQVPAKFEEMDAALAGVAAGIAVSRGGM